MVTLIKGDVVRQFRGGLEGQIALEKRGERGFGYDPVFIPNEYPQMTLAELGEDVKNGISHRYKALMQMRGVLSE